MIPVILTSFMGENLTAMLLYPPCCLQGAGCVKGIIIKHCGHCGNSAGPFLRIQHSQNPLHQHEGLYACAIHELE